mmetsp:Transcript_10555/g.16039  ORF Transcript_10555/g.16039 Transcript_10555/m.16039 type:complete len:478 (-) Transcript_10555:72-1505(-)
MAAQTTSTNNASALLSPSTQKFDESIDHLSQSTQSLLRTMRLDVVLLGSQQDESRSTLSKLEQDWEMLQKLLEQQRNKEEERREEEGEEEEEEEETRNGKEQEHLEGVIVVDKIRDDTQEQKAPFRQSRRHSSSIEWSEDGLSQSGDEPNTSNDQDQQAIRTLNLSDYSNPNSSSHKSSSTERRLDRSNFDWGTDHDDDDKNDMEEEDRKAEQSAPLTLDVMLKQAKRQTEIMDSKIGNAGGDDVPPIKRMFGWGRDKQRDSKLSTNSTTTESSSFFGRRATNKKQEGADDAASAITECTTGTNNNRNVWQSLFQRRVGNNNNNKKGSSSEEKTGKKNNVPSSSSAPTPKGEDLSEAISTMQVKLRGCDSAASSLHQLVSFQKRQITDLQHERNRLKVLYEFEALHSRSELKSLATQAESAQVERERKICLLQEAERCRSIFVDKEEKLKEELECIRMELFMLNIQLETSGREATSL